MSTKHNSKHSKKQQIERQSEDSISSNSDSGLSDEIIEVTKKEKKPQHIPQPIEETVIKKPVSVLKQQSMAKAREARAIKHQKSKEEDENAKKLIEKAYRAEVEAGLSKTLLPKYERKIKKEILEDLKKKKVEQLKKQYGYQSESSDSSSEGSSSEEEPPPIKSKKHTLKEVKKEKPEVKVEKKRDKVVEKPAPKPEGNSRSLLDMYKSFGF